jgi:hypothetical protein
MRTSGPVRPAGARGCGKPRWRTPASVADWLTSTVGVAQLVRASGCGPEGRGFNSPRSPHSAPRARAAPVHSARHDRASSSTAEQWTLNPLVLGSNPRGRTQGPRSDPSFDRLAARNRLEGPTPGTNGRAMVQEQDLASSVRPSHDHVREAAAWAAAGLGDLDAVAQLRADTGDAPRRNSGVRIDVI